MDILSLLLGGVVGLYSGVFANILYRKITYNKKPNISVCSNFILAYNSKNVPVVRFKILNKSMYEITDIKMKLYGVRYFDTQKTLKSLDLISSQHIDYLESFNKKSEKNCDYAYRTSFKNVDNIHEKIEEYDNLLLFIQATEVYNSTIQTIHKYFTRDNLKNYEWDFNICESCNLIKRENITKPSVNKSEFDLIKNCPFVSNK